MDERFQPSDPSTGPSAGAPAEATADSTDGPPNEIEPGVAFKEEVSRFSHHPRAEASRLERVEQEGESGATPYLFIVSALKIIVPVVIFALVVALLTYYLS